MATIYDALRPLNQGQAFVPGWNNQATLKDITAYRGTDGNNFLPVNDRNNGGGYSTGVSRRLGTGGTLESGYPVVRFVSPAITDGQIDYLVNTAGGGVESFNVTVRYHRYDSVGKADTFVANAILNLNLGQLPGLARQQNAYVNFVWEFVLVEVL